MSVAVEQWYPDISIGIGSVYLDPSFYRSGLALSGDDSKDVAVWVFHHAADLIGMWSDERIPHSLSNYGRLIVNSPAHRKAHIGARISTTPSSVH